MVEAGADPGFLAGGVKIYKGGFDLKIVHDYLIVYADFLLLPVIVLPSVNRVLSNCVTMYMCRPR